MPRPAGHLSYLHICRYLFTSISLCTILPFHTVWLLEASGYRSTIATDVQGVHLLRRLYLIASGCRDTSASRLWSGLVETASCMAFSLKPICMTLELVQTRNLSLAAPGSTKLMLC